MQHYAHIRQGEDERIHSAHPLKLNYWDQFRVSWKKGWIVGAILVLLVQQ